MRDFLRRIAFVALLAPLGACLSLVANYDPYFDQQLNTLSETTAAFLAGATAGGPERRANSPEAIAYYATSGNVLDRLLARATATRGRVACPTNAGLTDLVVEDVNSALPADYLRFDCREYSLYVVRVYLDQLAYFQATESTLNPGEAQAAGGILQTAIIGTISTFLNSRTTP